MIKKLFLFACLCVGVSYAVLGVDISMDTCENGVSVGTWQCIVNAGYSFAIIETWGGGYQFDSNIGTIFFEDFIREDLLLFR